MKKLSTVLCLGVCVSLLLLSCSRPQAGNDAGGSDQRGAADTGKKGKTAVVLGHKAALYAEEGGAMKYKAAGTIGEIVEWKNSVKKAIRDSDKQEREFTKIATNDGDYWIQSVLVAGDAVPGIIVNDDTVLYSKPDATAPTGATIPKYAIVGVHPAKDSGNFAAVSAYLEGEKSPVITERYVKKENLTTAQNDVRATQLLFIARLEKNDVVKKELLKSALEENSSLGDMIQAELDALAPAAEEPIPAEETEPAGDSAETAPAETN